MYLTTFCCNNSCSDYEKCLYQLYTTRWWDINQFSCLSVWTSDFSILQQIIRLINLSDDVFLIKDLKVFRYLVRTHLWRDLEQNRAFCRYTAHRTSSRGWRTWGKARSTAATSSDHQGAGYGSLRGTHKLCQI